MLGKPRTSTPSSGVLDPDATAIADGGGLVSAELRPIEGGEQIARVCVDIASWVPNLALLERTVNGQPGLVAQQDGITVTVYAFDIAGDRIKHIWAVRNPQKLRPWTTGLRVSAEPAAARDVATSAVTGCGRGGGFAIAECSPRG